ncbi:pentapeptide repeat-containing protein [Streptomyces lavendulocolor]|uniref:pentapeptide repeat-containing protein n=1 Tax=Streptomyces lavendulocolor TaxID=67316 RepID=UPI003C2FB873
MSTRSRKLWMWVLGTLAVLLGVGAFGVALWQVPWWMDAKHLDDIEPAQATAITGVRTALLALGAGGLAAVGVIYTHRTLHQNREGQVTDRYTKAIGQIASDKPVEQLGGIYALERIMRDSVKDHATIVEVLAAFVREHAPAPVPISAQDRMRLARQRLRTGAPIANTPSGRTADNADRRPTEPVQAALTVLARRPRDRDEPFQLDLARTDLRGVEMANGYLKGAKLYGARLEGAKLGGAHLEGATLSGAHLEWADLDRAHLERAKLYGAHLEKVTLRGAHLEEAILSGAHLERAILGRAHLEKATLFGAHLEEASLSEAHLEEASLSRAHLKEADLGGAHLKEVDLGGANLEKARDLTVEQLMSARPTQTTVLPAHFAVNAKVVARIAAVMREEQPY